MGIFWRNPPPPIVYVQNDQHVMGIILRNVCWGVTDPPPPWGPRQLTARPPPPLQDRQKFSDTVGCQCSNRPPPLLCSERDAALQPPAVCSTCWFMCFVSVRTWVQRAFPRRRSPPRTFCMWRGGHPMCGHGGRGMVLQNNSACPGGVPLPSDPPTPTPTPTPPK